ncbi:MAG: hypothetical protein QM817_38630 [Archangium sp.]
MHFIDADVAVIFDSWGFTTIELATGKVRMEKATSGSWFSCNGGTALVHNERGNRRVARGVPALAQVKLASGGYDLKYQHLAVLADGKRAMRGDGSGGLKLYDIGSGKESSVKLGAGTKLKPFTLGARLDPFVGEYEQEVFCGTDDAFVLLSGDGTLRGGKLGKKNALEQEWTVKCGFPQGVLRVRPHGDGTFVSAWHPALNRSFCALITGGKTVVTREVESISPVVFDGARLVFQPTEKEVVRETFDGKDTERFAPSFTGAGELLAEGDHLLIVSPDRETVHEITGSTHRVFNRRLGDTTAKERPVLRELEARFNRLARVANQVLTQSAVFLPQYGRGIRPGYQFGHGDLGFLRLVASAWVVKTLQNENQGRFSLGSYSNPTTLRPIDAKELQRDFEAIDATPGLDFLACLDFMQHPLEECFGGSFHDDEKVKVKKPMERDAEQALLWAVIERVKAKKPTPVAKSVAKWSKQALTPAAFIKQLDPGTDDQAWFDAQVSIGWLVLDYFGEDALEVMVDWFTQRPSNMVRSNAHIVGSVAKRMMKQYPKTKKPFTDAVQKATAAAKGEEDKRFFEWLGNDLAR